jgi:DMSO/TMAO reductase YedYZ molybdopterin-dependent catalytic subunit/thiosulfate reductase cytochrome b subunit
MIPFDEARRAVHYPEDRRHYVWLRPQILAALCIIVIFPVAAAWLQFLVLGLPPNPVYPLIDPTRPSTPHGFPGWLRLVHFTNFFFVMLLVRSGLSILFDHPRLYFTDHCTPGQEWMRFTPTQVPTNRVWTAKDDARYISPLLALPGYRHSVGMARSWHFLSVFGYLLTAIIWTALLLSTDQWKRVVPSSWDVLPQAWNVFVHYCTFHLPAEPDGFYYYNPLQKLTYFGVIFFMAPAALLTGLAMSPAVDNHFKWYARVFGGRQTARSLHFGVLVGYLVFLIIHVGLVIYTGFVRNMNHIVLNQDNASPQGMLIGLVVLAGVVLCWVAAHYTAWTFPRQVQRLDAAIGAPVRVFLLNWLKPSEHYSRNEISPHFWPNGKMPTSDKWKNLAANQFKDFRLEIGGLVERPVSLSLEELRKLAEDEHISMHHCIQGWSGIAQWRGVPMAKVIELVKPKPEARVVVFFSFGDSLYGGFYYDTQTLENILKPECLLAYEMNDKPLPEVYGAPLRLRVENQLGYKMVKWIERIEFVRSEKEIGQGHGGKNEEDEYYDLVPNI